MDHPLVSITVCVRNGDHWIDGCLDALVSQTYPNVEILLVDDGSTDGGSERVNHWHDPHGERGPPVRVHHQPALGLSAGRHWAVEHAKGTWVAITDIDVRPEHDWITNLVLASSPVDDVEKVVAVTGRTAFDRAEDLVSRIRSVEIASKYRSRPRRTSLANGPCSMFHRESLRTIGGFDPTWYHAEDMEVSLRLLEAGGTIVYAPDALVRHVPERGTTLFLHKRRRDARAHVRILRHHPRRKRKGPAFDFLGSSTMVLLLLPIWLLIAGFSLPFASSLLGSVANTPVILDEWSIQGLFLSAVLLVVQEAILWRGSLGVVNRVVINSSTKGKLSIMIGVRWLTFRWSLALWQGTLLGCMDALLGRHGHRNLFSSRP